MDVDANGTYLAILPQVCDQKRSIAPQAPVIFGPRGLACFQKQSSISMALVRSSRIFTATRQL